MTLILIPLALWALFWLVGAVLSRTNAHKQTKENGQ